MSMNWRYGNIANGVTLEMDVDGERGDVVAIGANGLAGYIVKEKNGDDGASVRLLPTQGVIEINSGTFSVGDAVYGDDNTSGVTYSDDDAGTFVGYAVTDTTGDSTFVFLGGSAAADSGN